MTRTRSASKPVARPKPPFDAIVRKSLEQMQAYGAMVKSVRRTVDQFIFSKGRKAGGGTRATEPKKPR